VRIEGRPTLEIVAFRLFPIPLGSVVLVAASVLRKRHSRRERGPDAGRSVDAEAGAARRTS
jgi:hypothetical protein